MKTFRYEKPVTSSADMRDAVEYMAAHRFRIVKLEEPKRTRYAMRGKRDRRNRARTYYIAGSFDDLRAEYDRSQNDV